jgi:ribosome-associated protein
VRITRSLEIPDAELVLRFSRSSGPGGQNVNRRATKVELTFDVLNSPSLGPRRRERLMQALGSRLDADGKLHITAQDARTQAENRARVLERFRTSLVRALAPPPPPRRPTKPTAGATERRLRAKRIRGEQKRRRTRPDVE